METVCVVDPFMEVDAGVHLGLKGLYRRMDEIPEGVEFEIIVLAIKPQIFETFDATWAHRLAPDGMVVSIMAGVGSDRIQASAGRNCDVVRCMPNMAAAVGRSVNVAFATNPARKGDFQMLFSGSGPVRWIDAEADIHLTTAVSGSGPA
jgi:pyrroline-5-carboxylate reductase